MMFSVHYANIKKQHDKRSRFCTQQIHQKNQNNCYYSHNQSRISFFISYHNWRIVFCRFCNVGNLCFTCKLQNCASFEIFKYDKLFFEKCNLILSIDDRDFRNAIKTVTTTTGTLAFPTLHKKAYKMKHIRLCIMVYFILVVGFY